MLHVELKMSSDTVIHFANETDHLENDRTDLLSDYPVIGVLIAVFLSILCLLTVFGNAVVLHAIRTERRLQTVSNSNVLLHAYNSDKFKLMFLFYFILCVCF